MKLSFLASILLICMGCATTHSSNYGGINPAQSLINCSLSEDKTTVVCPRKDFVDGINNCVDNWQSLEVCKVNETVCQKLCTLDKAQLESDLDWAESKKWIWAAVGFALGAAATGVTVWVVTK